LRSQQPAIEQDWAVPRGLHPRWFPGPIQRSLGKVRPYLVRALGQRGEERSEKSWKHGQPTGKTLPPACRPRRELKHSATQTDRGPQFKCQVCNAVSLVARMSRPCEKSPTGPPRQPLCLILLLLLLTVRRVEVGSRGGAGSEFESQCGVSMPPGHSTVGRANGATRQHLPYRVPLASL
jgi:hypothetical protein